MRSSWLYLAIAVRARHRARLDLHRVGADGDVGDRRVLGLARAVAHHRRVAGALRHLDGGEGLGQRPDLVDLDEDRVGDAALDSFVEDLRVRDEEIVTDQLHALAELPGEVLPAGPVVLGHSVLDRHDRVLVAPRPEHVGPVGRRERQALAFQMVLAVPEELARRAVERERDLLARHVAGLLDGLQDQLDRRLVALHARRETTLVAHRGAHAGVVDQLLQRVEHLGAVAHRLARTSARRSARSSVPAGRGCCWRARRR